MKRLYNCQAWYDRSGLVSYNTPIISIVNDLSDNGRFTQRITMCNYRSNTTLSHIRKYIRLLKETYQYELANKIQRLYDYAGKHKSIYMIYMSNGDIHE